MLLPPPTVSHFSDCRAALTAEFLYIVMTYLFDTWLVLWKIKVPCAFSASISKVKFEFINNCESLLNFVQPIAACGPNLITNPGD
jgi:hypothetical protein